MRDYKPQAQKTRIEKLLQSFAQTPLGGRLFITVFPAIDRRLMPLTRGRLSTGMGQPIVLLHVRGARSGIERTIPLLATKTGDTVLELMLGLNREVGASLVIVTHDPRIASRMNRVLRLQDGRLEDATAEYRADALHGAATATGS